MIRLILLANPFGRPPLQEEGELPSLEWPPIALSDELRLALIDWNQRITFVIAHEELHEPSDLPELYRKLNSEGKLLADRLNEQLKDKATVAYRGE